MDKIKLFLSEFLPWGDNTTYVDVTIVIAIGIVAVIVYYIAKWILFAVGNVISKTSVTWDDVLFDHRFLSSVAQLAPAIAVKQLLPLMTEANSGLHNFVADVTSLYVLFAVVRILTIFISNSFALFLSTPKLQSYAIKGIFQTAQLIVICIGVIIALSIILGREPGAILAAIGASAAVLMLVFKDTILGLVASVQLSANKMLQRGDWIVCDGHSVNGEVEDVSLTTIKVRNWDNSITTIPPYTLVSDSFKNYQAMREYGGRRVERSILIDVNTVRFLAPKEVEELGELGFLDGLEVDAATRIINLQLLRRYLDQFLATDPRVNHDMISMVRQMQPGSNGLPLQLYFFTSEVRWKEFETIQSDIFDHVYAVVNKFGLRMFQSPAGSDFNSK